MLASRSDPPLALARLRAGGQLAELRADDLRFSADEAGSLLREAIGGLPGAAVAALAARTEEWVAGLQLAGLSLRGQHDADVAGFVVSFGGSHRYVLDYLTEEVLDRQTGEQWRAAGEHPLAAAAGHFIGQIQRAQGRLDAALDTYQQALEITAPAGQPSMPAAGIAMVGMAEVA